jgi:hypothetical protein
MPDIKEFDDDTRIKKKSRFETTVSSSRFSTVSLVSKNSD